MTNEFLKNPNVKTQLEKGLIESMRRQYEEPEANYPVATITPRYSPETGLWFEYQDVAGPPDVVRIDVPINLYVKNVKDQAAKSEAHPQKPVTFTEKQIDAAARALFECDSCVFYQYSLNTEEDWNEAKEGIYRNVREILNATIEAGKQPEDKL